MICHQLNLIILFWELVNFSGIVSEKTCALNELFACPDGETCEQLRNLTSFGVCKCKSKYIRSSPNSACKPQINTDNLVLPTPESVYSQGTSVSAIAGGLLTAILLVIFVILLVFAAKRYKWIHRVREKLQQYRARHYDTVLVSQEDDPPLA